MRKSWHAEKWNGGISARDLQRVATAHDFMWTDREVADMIHLFDSDGDAKVSTCCS
jgi:Ca2+-binding EF-hand superfamily protein